MELAEMGLDKARGDKKGGLVCGLWMARALLFCARFGSRLILTAGATPSECARSVYEEVSVWRGRDVLRVPTPTAVQPRITVTTPTPPTAPLPPPAPPRLARLTRTPTPPSNTPTPTPNCLPGRCAL